MKWEHWRAIFWLHWRLRINQLKRGGLANAVLLAVLGCFAVLGALGLLVLGFLLGAFALSDTAPAILMYVWDGIVVPFLLVWVIGLMAELQRSEVLSLNKLLHLPVSLTGAFVVNYLSSLFSLTLLFFVPAMLGLALGLIVGRGPVMLLLLPALAAFLLMVTALTYQFQGWLASLMANKRRRQTILFLVMAVFLLLSQLPNLINFLVLSKGTLSPAREGAATQARELANKRDELHRALAEKKITLEQHNQRVAKLVDEETALVLESSVRVTEEHRQSGERAEQIAWYFNVFVPVGWLPLGAMSLASGQVVPALLATLGLTLLGTASLWRCYRTTLRLYTGAFTSGRKRQAAAPKAKRETAPARLLVERKLPWLPEPVAATALASFRSLTRAPETKMMLLSSLLMVVVFGALLGKGLPDLTEDYPPLLAFAGMGLILLTMSQLVGNQFGYDRNGFRVYVLCGARRRDILLGKNLAVAPFALGLGLAVTVALLMILPMRVDDFLCVLPQLLSMYLLFCLVANWLSILVPVRVSGGVLGRPKMGVVNTLLYMAVYFVLFPMVLVPTLLPFGARLLLVHQGWAAWAPVCVVVSVLECVAVVCLYRLVLSWQGHVLQALEQRVLEIVRTKAE